MTGARDITDLRHVRANAEKRVPDEIANRTVCRDSDRFKPLFDDVRRELDAGIRETVRLEDESEEGDVATGIIYVLRSKSDDPDVAANRDLLHKIGVASCAGVQLGGTRTLDGRNPPRSQRENPVRDEVSSGGRHRD